MTDQTPMDGFETRLTGLVRSYTEPAAKPIDAVLTARTAMASSTRGGALARLWPVRQDRRVAWLLVLGALVMTIAALAVAVGSRSSLFVQAPAGPGRIVFVRDGDLFVAETDGSGQSLIASGDAGDAKFGYLTAAWSPDMRHIAAVRDVGGAFLTPGVDLMTADGALVRTVALDPGCGPSIVVVAGQHRGRDRDMPGRCSEGHHRTGRFRDRAPHRRARCLGRPGDRAAP